MNRRFHLPFVCAALAALFLVLLIAGCGEDDTTTPAQPGPRISMSLKCINGLIGLTVKNTGDAMQEASPFVAAFEDGHRDTLLLSVGADDSLACFLSNIHGGVTVTNTRWDLEASTGDCLADLLGAAANINMNDFLPTTPPQFTFICTYTLYLSNFNYDHATFQLIRTDSGLTVQYVYTGITGNFSAPSPGILCPDITGSIAISSIVVETEIDIVEGENPQVTLGSTTAAINGLVVNVNGNLGFLVELITSLLGGQFTDQLETSIAEAIRNTVGNDLGGVVIVNSSCES